MTEQEKKKFILKSWSGASGKKISLMLKHFWNLNENKSGEISNSGEDIVSIAEKIFAS